MLYCHWKKERVEVIRVKEVLGGAALKMAYKYLDSNPERNAPKLMKIIDRLDADDSMKGQRDAVRQVLSDRQGNWYQLLLSMWDDIDPGVRRALFQNFVVNATAIGGHRQLKLQAQYDCNIPWAILMDPTSACNLHCVGCWAAEYGNRMNMSLDTLDRIVQQGVDLGVYFYVLSGGEPLVRKKDVIALCERHPECFFTAFTNGTLIDEEFADEMLRVRNFAPAISIEGFEEATDSRRGDGTYQAVVKAMEILKRRKLLFGASCCYTSRNTEAIGSEAFFDDMIEKGAKFIWFFTYMPVGVGAVPGLMVSPEQRELMYRQVRAFRETKPIVTLDFWNDGEFVKGCIAGGRRYLHINAGGDIEPCAFIHYADASIYTHTLLEALQSPLFMQYHQNQPFNENHLRPCPLLDNPEALAGWWTLPAPAPPTWPPRRTCTRSAASAPKRRKTGRSPPKGCGMKSSAAPACEACAGCASREKAASIGA